MRILFPIYSLCAFVPRAVAVTGPEVALYLETHLSNASAVFLPSDSNYTQETMQRWNRFSAPTYLVSVKPATDIDVRTAVS